MKNAVAKNDKKRRKQLTEDITKLEAELNQKHKEELVQLKSTEDTQDEVEVEVEVEEVVNGVESLGDKKAAQEKERESRIAEAEAGNLLGVRHQEGLKLAHKLSQRQLQIKEIASDGHCMYRAVEDQLGRRALARNHPGLVLSLKELRSRTAEYMRAHVDDFLPFLTHPSMGDMYSAVDFEKYCDEVDHTTAWGGQLELRALTEVLKLSIEVIQADAAAVVVVVEVDVADEDEEEGGKE
ncbi:hypothetical protein CRUP_024727 [Coryphaenoides rupestris]|nr:hypothetical protein CRUP_024727 [Coryphaenoides rupestris]